MEPKGRSTVLSVKVKKRPDTSSKYQAEDDFTKLMKMMKDSVDEQLYLGIDNPTSLGLLVEGMYSIYA